MWGKCLLVGTCMIALGAAAFAWHRTRGIIPDNPDEVTLFSIDGMKQRNPVDRDKPTDQELLYEFPVLGKVSITDPELQRGVITAVKRDLNGSDPSGYLCFFPRHVLRVVKGSRTIDVVICFQCNRYRVYVNGKLTHDEDRPVDKSSQELLNQILTDAGIPLAA